MRCARSAGPLAADPPSCVTVEEQTESTQPDLAPRSGRPPVRKCAALTSGALAVAVSLAVSGMTPAQAGASSATSAAGHLRVAGTVLGQEHDRVPGLVSA